MIKGPKKETQPEIVIKTVKNCPKSYDDTKRVLLVDADSICYLATYFPEDSEMFFPTQEEQIEEAKFRVRNKLQEIQNNVEEHYNIIHCMLFVGGKGNFRYKIYPEYKANRKNTVKSDILPIIKEYMLELGVIACDGYEADDAVIEAMKDVKGNCVIACIDKDVIYHAPDTPIYDYRSHNDVLGEFKWITEKESRYARACQMLVGDSGDNIKGAIGIGEAYCKKNLTQDMTDYQFIRAIFTGYLKSTKDNSVEAKTQMRLNYNLLKLHTKEEIKSLLKKYEH
jgi:5'-3' exonuclease